MATEVFANNASTTLNGAINNSVTSLVVTSASQFPSSGNFRIIIDSEIMIVTAVSGTTFTVTRNAESTVAASHSNGATVTCILTAGAIAAIPYKSGTVVQVVNAQDAAVATGTTTIPFDNTIPQNTEGTQFISASITPTSASNKLLITATLNASSGTGDRRITAALFQDTTANALAVRTIQATSAQATVAFPLGLAYYMTAGTTSSTTFKIRIGANAASTITFNGESASGLFNGTFFSSLTITEIAV